jgi:hypothetical protein
MKKMEIKRFEKEPAVAEIQKDGIVAFQMVEITINYFGKIMTEMHDTKILKDGRQLIINGNGFIEANLDITSL